MSEWWTYELGDFLLFSPETYRRLFDLYNRDLWPAQVAGVALGAAIFALLRVSQPARTRAAVAILAIAWLWVAWAFHYERYAGINWVAPYFALAFGVEAVLLLATGTLSARLAVLAPGNRARRTGLALLLFALVAQPCVDLLLGRPWTQVGVFGSVPDPTVVATLGVLLTMHGHARGVLLVIPLLWCAISGSFLLAMESPDALVMFVAAAIAMVVAANGPSGPVAARPTGGQ